VPSDTVPRVAVAISTYRRAHLLPRLVRALEAQTLRPSEFEVLIVDDGSPDDTSATLARLAANTSIQMQPIRSESNQGQAAGRNTAWRASRAPVIAFTDDDCVPTAAWLETGLRAIETDGGLVVGRTMPNPEQAERLLRPFSRTIEDEGTRFFNTCNIFYSRTDLEGVGGFDETFSAHGGEDIDLAKRVQERGTETHYAPDAVVLHDVQPGSFVTAIRDTIRWTGIPHVMARHPDLRALLRWRTFWKPSHPPVILALAAVVISPWQLLSLVGVAPWLWYRIWKEPFCPGPRRRLLALPGGFVLDLLEVATMIRGSIRYRTLVL
jgi:glycosyltransferase involved in cell wall biosynthesis